MPKITLRPPLTLVMTLEGLATAPLGCYGCSWNDTPAIDQLAAEGIVWDRWISPLDHPNGLIETWLRDSQEAVRDYGKEGSTRFLTDDKNLTIPPDLFGFGFVTRLKLDRSEAPAEQFDQTRLVQLAAAALDQVEPSTSLIWLHSDSLREVWDAPLESDDDTETEDRAEPEQDANEVDKPKEPAAVRLPDTSAVPKHQMLADDDPDLLFAWMQRYAAQVRVLDGVVDSLVESLRGRKLTVLLAGSSGFSLGQNGWIGHRVGPPRSHDLRLPMIVSTGGPLRVPSLRRATELSHLLQAHARSEPLITPPSWCAVDDEFSPAIVTESDRARRLVSTSKWFFLEDESAGEQLFLKPDDVEDVNDVARLRPDVIDRLLETR
ncbi:hypothetical protein FYK55_01640 [Roseiconus nitratireducens]|uniref:Sulfatase N-terminal domain-containing protein n=1 Tax=Roseiconus nitratireducens TaxID=2605748 RepID=A0A5M6DHX5_9BACT|nr:hypothetical protein [Roseiconus nitratireducens]KAA5547144.1 hypothetical protein FYK55_01640 [Roseiconus nitratireducens]